MIVRLLLLLLLSVRGDLILSHHKHGHGNEHTDQLRCVASGQREHGTIAATDLVQDFVLPDTLYCTDVSAGTGNRHVNLPSDCFDRAGRVHYRLMVLNCANGACVAHFDCAPLVMRFWLSLAATVGAMLVMVVVRVLWLPDAGRQQQRRPHERI